MRNENKLKFQKQEPQGGNPGMSSSAIVQAIWRTFRVGGLDGSETFYFRTEK